MSARQEPVLLAVAFSAASAPLKTLVPRVLSLPKALLAPFSKKLNACGRVHDVRAPQYGIMPRHDNAEAKMSDGELYPALIPPEPLPAGHTYAAKDVSVLLLTLPPNSFRVL